MNDIGNSSVKTDKSIKKIYKRIIFVVLAAAAISVCAWGVSMLAKSLGSGEPPDTGTVLTLPTTQNSSTSYPSDTTLSGNPGETTTTPAVNLRRDGVYTFLIAGMDQESVLTDVLMVALFDTINNKLNVLSIPRDTYSNVTTRSAYNINLAYPCGGLEALQNEVMYLIGYVPDFCIRVNMDGFKNIIQKVGGVWFDVPEDMFWEDPKQNLIIDLKAGYQQLNADKALQLMRYRHYKSGLEDIERVKVRQKFLAALASQLLEPANVAKIPELAGIVLDNIKKDDDFSLAELTWFARQAVELKNQDIQFHLLPGGFGEGPYWYPNKSKIIQMVNDHFNPLTEEITTVNIYEASK